MWKAGRSAPGQAGTFTAAALRGLAGLLASNPSFATIELPDLLQVTSPLGLRVCPRL